MTTFFAPIRAACKMCAASCIATCFALVSDALITVGRETSQKHHPMTKLRLAPEMRSWTAELDGDSRLAINPFPNPDCTALLLRLIPHVCHEQPLAARDPGLQPQQRPVLVDFKCLGLFVERLLFRVPAVNEQGYTTRRTLACPALGGVSFRGFFARFVGILYGVPWRYMGPFSFSFFQGIPDAAHWSLPKSSMGFDSSVNDSLRGESRTGNAHVSFR